MGGGSVQVYVAVSRGAEAQLQALGIPRAGGA